MKRPNYSTDMNLEGHFCQDCGCGLEHGCVCGMCDMTPEEIKETFNYPEPDPIEDYLI